MLRTSDMWLRIRINRDLYRELKILAAESMQTVTACVTRLISEAVGKEEEEGS